MTPTSSLTPGTAWFLNGLSNLQTQEAQTQRELSSGYQINDASDSPSQTPALIQLGSNLAAVQAYQTNLGNVQAEANTADQAIGTGISLLQNAETFAAQGDNTGSTAATNQTLAIQVENIQQQLVSIANTTVQGRYIFGGDQDGSAPYQYDASSATGVDSLTAQVSSRVIVDPQGQSVYQGLTAQQIFDPVDSTGAPTANNTFAALQSLQTALQANDQPGIAAALTSIQSASTYVNQQQAYYGAAEDRITSEQNNAANQVTALQTQIGNIRDTDEVQAATDLTTESTDQSAALGAEAEISAGKTLFSYLG
jgi:flagellar hook-associated protein 3 FlgL